MVVFNGSMDFEKIRNAMIDGIIMPNEGITQHYLDTVGRNYRLPVVSASYGNAEGFSRAVPRVEIDMVRVMELAVRALRETGTGGLRWACLILSAPWMPGGFPSAR